MKRRVAFFTLAMMAASLGLTPAFAEPRHYALDADQTSLTFIWEFGADKVTGRLPSGTADITIDFADQRNSAVTATLDIRGAEAGFPFATQAMTGPRVLDAETFPTVTFASNKVIQTGAKAEVMGDLTLRGVTRPVTLNAELFRQPQAEIGDLDHIAIRLEGTVNRHDFGASGWPDDVGPNVSFVVLAYLDRTG